MNQLESRTPWQPHFLWASVAHVVVNGGQKFRAAGKGLESASRRTSLDVITGSTFPSIAEVEGYKPIGAELLTLGALALMNRPLPAPQETPSARISGAWRPAKEEQISRRHGR